jgi:hypothetical protein
VYVSLSLVFFRTTRSPGRTFFVLNVSPDAVNVRVAAADVTPLVPSANDVPTPRASRSVPSPSLSISSSVAAEMLSEPGATGVFPNESVSLSTGSLRYLTSSASTACEPSRRR